MPIDPGVLGRLATGQTVLVLDEIDSTNTYAMRLAHEGEVGPLWVRANRQNRGRGRSGRDWLSIDGNLYASLLVTLRCSLSAAHQLSFVAGVAALDAIRAAGTAKSIGLDGLRLKWPNDIMIGTSKVAGILAESSAAGGGVGLTAVIGVGINLAGHPELLDRPVTHLAQHGLAVAPAAMMSHLAVAMDAELGRWASGSGFAEVRARWLERAGPVGEEASVNTNQGRVQGTFAGLDQTGALLLRDTFGAIHTFTYGDVTLGPAKEPPQ